MNNTRKSPGQIWHQSSSYDSNSKSGPIHGLQRNQRVESKKKSSVFGFVARVLTCRRDIGGDYDVDVEDHAPPATVQYLTHKSLRRNKTLNPSASYKPSKASDGQQSLDNLSFQDISKTTGNFSPTNIIGEGGFGTVYKGTLRNGFVFAIKRAKKEKYDKTTATEFKNEILTLSKIEHLNLVRFYGSIEHEDERMILVEYVPHGNLRDHLDGTRGNGLEMGERLDILIDVAHAVTYLHTYTDQPIIHRDIKSPNILISDKLRAKVTDFGFARVKIEDPEATHISTQVKGTAGYLDPEYLNTYQLTDRSDVYSFGVLLVEVVTGRQPIEFNKPANEKLTTRWAMQRLKQGEVVLAMDPKLNRNPASMMVVEKVLRLARQCVAPTRQSRPSMMQCGEILWRIRKDYHEQNDAMTATHLRQVPEIDARKNRREFFGLEDSGNQRFQSV
ncbi:calmodulin-binding receptor-like cytoplasmic kinase 1 [Bidens hawaiensis]|uniref:calmodulin-binding receptor-like cytoplasmic kinase 1 n=1 Tax=Bidens hawaiensis TaxID=980011 RepID=UPI00404B42BB